MDPDTSSAAEKFRFKKTQFNQNSIITKTIQAKLFQIMRAGSLNRDAGADATADSTDSKKTWIFKSFSRIT